ncbi:MAG: hypothetical protein AABZ60_02215 [Planctomycetota bacterium]
MECKYYPAGTYKNPGCDLYIPNFCTLTTCYKIDKVSESEKKRRKFETKIEEEADLIVELNEEGDDEE